MGVDPTVVSPAATSIPETPAGCSIKVKIPIWVHVLPDQWGQGCQVSGCHASDPMRLCQKLLQRQRVDVDHAVLYRVQSEHADLVVLAHASDAKTGDLSASLSYRVETR